MAYTALVSYSQARLGRGFHVIAQDVLPGGLLFLRLCVALRPFRHMVRPFILAVETDTESYSLWQAAMNSGFQ